MNDGSSVELSASTRSYADSVLGDKVIPRPEVSDQTPAQKPAASPPLQQSLLILSDGESTPTGVKVAPKISTPGRQPSRTRGGRGSKDQDESMMRMIALIVDRIIPSDIPDRTQQIKSFGDEILAAVRQQQAQKARPGEPSYLDKAIEGLSKETQAEVLRVMVNTGMQADDPANILLVVYGHIIQASETIPSSINAAQRDLIEIVDRLDQNVQILPEQVKAYKDMVLEYIESESTRLAEIMIKSAQAELMPRVREQLTVAAVDVLSAHQKEIEKNAAPMLLRLRAITAVYILFVLFCGAIGGYGYAILRPPLTAAERTDLSYGDKLVRMWNDPKLSSGARAEIGTWLRSHP